MSTFDLSLEKQHGNLVAGVDEVGYGPWAGPVVACAVIIKKQAQYMTDIRDSKQLSFKKRLYVYNLLTNDHFTIYSLGQASVEEIDKLNVLKATFLAMGRAVDGLSISPDHILIDGIRDPLLNYQSTLIKKGDQKSLSIAAASIIAKITRDNIMKNLATENPFYGWDKNVGYGTKQHELAIKTYGISEHHRKSYSPIKKFQSQFKNFKQA
ncbi:MAG: ribonuclease HII [Alphaproteobacteria bacterium]